MPDKTVKIYLKTDRLRLLHFKREISSLLLVAETRQKYQWHDWEGIGFCLPLKSLFEMLAFIWAQILSSSASGKCVTQLASLKRFKYVYGGG